MQKSILFIIAAILTVGTIQFLVPVHVNALKCLSGSAGTVCSNGAVTGSNGASATACVGGSRTLTSSDGRTSIQPC